jgi:N-acyl-D-amino-acid deacylase
MIREADRTGDLPRLDLVLRGGRIVDGTGRPAFRADLGIRGDRIAALGDLSASDAEEEIDVTGQVVAPGFIDAHTHDDRALLSGPDMAAKTSQGVTTVVTGNCGISLAPVLPMRDPPSTFHLLGDRSWFRFGDFGAYVDELARRPPAVNAVCLVGHTTLRFGAMADLGRAASGTEIAVMQEQLQRSLEAGAIGLSSGLHYPSARAAPTEEVIALAKVMQGRGLYATHMRDESDGVEASIEETLAIGRAADVPVLISHHKVIGPQNFGRSLRTLARIEAARHEQPVSLDLYPYVAGSTVLDPQRCDGRMRVLVTWSTPHPEQAGRDIAAIAAEWQCPTVEAAERLLPAGAIYFMLDEADVQRILQYPHTMIGSDGLPHDAHPHPRLWGTFPRVLGHYARDLGLLTVEEAVRRMTSLPAAILGLDGRGVLQAGAFADIVVFDPDTIIDRASFERPTEPAAGIALVAVNGTPVFIDGKALPAKPGRVLRRQRHAAPEASPALL